MKKIYLLLLLFACVAQGYAQVSLTASTGAGGPSNYTTLKEAFDAINTGVHGGSIAITITGTVTESATAVLNASGTGSASYTAVYIRPGGGMGSQVTGDLAAPLIELNGADRIVFDGLNTGGNSLTLSNINSSATASTVRWSNDASSDTIRNANLLGSSAASTTGTLFFSNGTATGNDNNMINNCNVAEAGSNTPANAIYSACTTGQENGNNTITNNNISNFFNPTLATAGILLFAGNTDWTISNNKFFQAAVRIFTAANTHRVIQITSGVNYLVAGNTIGGASASDTGVYSIGGPAASSRFIAIDLAVGNSVASSVQNNNITHFSFTTSNGSSSLSGVWCGIYVSSGDVNIGTVTGNNIGSTTGTGDITVIPTVAGSLVVPISSSGTGVINIAKNLIGSIDLVPTGVFSGNLPGIIVSGAAGTISVLNNTIGNATPNNMRIGTAGTTTGNGIARGILSSNSGTVTISTNTIRNMVQNSNNALALFRGIEFQQGTGSILSNNISNLSANGASSSFSTHEGIGIIITTTLAGVSVDGNTISNLTVTSASTLALTVSGIYLGTVNNISITRNRIFGLVNAGTSTSVTQPAVAAGIACRDGGALSTTAITNNMISLGNGQPGNVSFVGIWNQVNSVTGYTTKIYYNSINVEGNVAAGAQPSFCYYRGDFAASFAGPVMDIKNNIFTNNRIGGTGKHFAIANSYGNGQSSATGWDANASNFNVLNAGETIVAYWSGDKSFSAWQTASASDANSFSSVAVTYVNSASDLHLVLNANAGVNGKASPAVGYTTDYDNELRNPVTPDPGADEFIYDVLPIHISYFKATKQGAGAGLSWKAETDAASVQFDLERSGDAITFKSVLGINAGRERCQQPFYSTDNQLLPGNNYYRLKMTEANGNLLYSNTVLLLNKANGFALTGISPTVPSTGEDMQLNISAARKMVAEICITDIQGKLLIRQKVQLDAGSAVITLPSAKLPAGLYQLSILPSGENVIHSRFLVK